MHNSGKFLQKILLIIVSTLLLSRVGSLHVFGASQKVQIMYFHFSACDGCSDAQEYLSEVTTLLSEGDQSHNVDVRMINAFQSGGYTLMLSYFEAYSVPKEDQNCPIVFVGSHYYSGEEAIKSHLIEAVKNPGEASLIAPAGEQDAKISQTFNAMKPLNVFLTGLINGVNPCSMSMLLFFFSLLGIRKLNVLKAGIGFCLGKFVTYLFLGIVSYGILDSIDMNRYKFITKLIVLAIAFTIAFMNFRDYFAARHEKYEKIKVQLPCGLRRLNHSIIKRFTSFESQKLLFPVSALLGVFVSLGEFLCTGQIYLATILYMMKDSADGAFGPTALVYFLIYCVAIVIPLLVIAIFMNKGKELFEISETIRGKLPLIKLLNAVFFIVFAVLMMFLI